MLLHDARADVLNTKGAMFELWLLWACAVVTWLLFFAPQTGRRHDLARKHVKEDQQPTKSKKQKAKEAAERAKQEKAARAERKEQQQKQKREQQQQQQHKAEKPSANDFVVSEDDSSDEDEPMVVPQSKRALQKSIQRNLSAVESKGFSVHRLGGPKQEEKDEDIWDLDADGEEDPDGWVQLHKKEKKEKKERPVAAGGSVSSGSAPAGAACAGAAASGGDGLTKNQRESRRKRERAREKKEMLRAMQQDEAPPRPGMMSTRRRF